MSPHQYVRGNHFKIRQNSNFGNDTNKSRLLLQKFLRRLHSRNYVYIYKIVNIKIVVTIVLPVIFMYVFYVCMHEEDKKYIDIEFKPREGRYSFENFGLTIKILIKIYFKSRMRVCALHVFISSNELLGTC